MKNKGAYTFEDLFEDEKQADQYVHQAAHVTEHLAPEPPPSANQNTVILVDGKSAPDPTPFNNGRRNSLQRRVKSVDLQQQQQQAPQMIADGVQGRKLLAPLSRAPSHQRSKSHGVPEAPQPLPQPEAPSEVKPRFGQLPTLPVGGGAAVTPKGDAQTPQAVPDIRPNRLPKLEIDSMKSKAALGARLPNMNEGPSLSLNKLLTESIKSTEPKRHSMEEAKAEEFGVLPTPILTLSDTDPDAVNPGTTITINKEDRIIKDTKRARTIHAILASLGKPDREILAALWSMEPSVLNEERVDALLRCAPTDAEKKAVVEGKETKQINRADRFIVEATKIWRYDHRLRFQLFKLQFSLLADYLAESIKYLDEARKQLGHCKGLKQVLTVALAFYNAQTKTKHKSFNVSFLPHLRKAKVQGNKGTVLALMVRYISKHYNYASNFLNEITATKLACKVDTAFLGSEIERLDAISKSLDKELLKHYPSPKKEDGFEVTMKPFVKEARERVSTLTSAYKTMQQEAKKLAAAYGSSDMRVEDVYHFIEDFIQDYGYTQSRVRRLDSFHQATVS